MRRSSLSVAVSCLCLSAPASGRAAAPPTTELEILGEVPVVLSATRLIQPADDVPGAVTVIDRAMIRASGARDIAELLRYVPGFQVARRDGATALTTYHGLSDDAPRRMLVRVDGRSAYSPYFVSGIEWAKITVDIDDIDRIEVFRGTNAAAYGSNAFLGIVDIITRPAADSPRARVRLTEGANGLQERVLSLRQQFGAAAARLTVSQQRDHGLDPIDDDHRHQRLDARVDWPLNADDSLELHLGLVDTLAETGTGEATDPQRHTDSFANFAQVRWRRQLGGDDELKLTYFHQEERFDDPGFLLSPYLGIPGTSVSGDLHGRVLRDDLEAEHLMHLGEGGRLVWGAGLRRDRVSSARVFATDDDVVQRQSRLFANFEQHWRPWWTFNAGAMLEDTNTSGPRLSPRLAVNAHLSEQTTARIAWSRGYRNLTPFERRADIRYTEALTDTVLLQTFQPSGDLNPEKVTTRELGLRHQSGDGRSHVDLRIFHESVRDMLQRVTRPSPLSPALSAEAPVYIGGASADLHGAELSGIYRPTQDRWIGAHYTYTDIDASDPAAELSAPTHAYAVFGAVRLFAAWQLSGLVGYVGRMSWYDDDDWIDGYHHASVRIARHWRLGPANAELAVGMDRIDQAVADFRPELTRPTQGYVTLRLTY